MIHGGAIFFAIIAVYLAFEFRNVFRAYDALSAMRAECNAALRFFEWFHRNPGVYIGLSPEGRCLVCEWLLAIDWCSQTHSYMDLSEKRAMVLDLLNDLPPKPPSEHPLDECSRTRFFLYTYIHANVRCS